MAKEKTIQTAGQSISNNEADPLTGRRDGSIGKPFSRVDSEGKVKGEATFAADYKFENLAYAVPVYSTITKGRVLKINQSEAEIESGVIAVITPENAPKLNPPPPFAPGGENGVPASDLPILQNWDIYWNGQPIAVIVAETQEQAEAAAAKLHVEYEPETARTSFDHLKNTAELPKDILGEPTEIKIGDAEKALTEAQFKIDNIYRTPRYNHNAIELHASTALWNADGHLTVFDTVQYVWGVKNMFAKVFGIPPEKVRIVAPFVGGAFGGKGSASWRYDVLCAMAAKVVRRPVKMVFSRKGVFRAVGGRAIAEQRVGLGAEKGGKLSALIHTGTSAAMANTNFPEPFSLLTRHLYASKNFLISQKMIHLDMVPNSAMRAPGEAIGSFALESAIDELAVALRIDPIKLRLINEPAQDPTSGHEFSMRHIVEAYRHGAEKFGWNQKPPRSQNAGGWLVGQGVATAMRSYLRAVSKARVRINADGTAVVQAAAHEMGMGTATVQTQHAADRLGLPFNCVSFEYGDSNLPEAPRAGGSNQTASNIAAVTAAIHKALQQLLALAGNDNKSPLANLKYEETEARNGGLLSKTDLSKAETYASILKRNGLPYLEAEATSGTPTEMTKFSMHSYGAQFAEVRVNEETGEVRISRWLGSFDCGKILNPKTAISQFRGGIIMGIGMALMEETLFDERIGRIMNPSLAEYHVPVSLDIPVIEIIYNDIVDEHAPLGAHGIGEIGITGAAAAIANAVFNATGKRIRELPITLDKLI